MNKQNATIEWKQGDSPVNYPDALTFMEARVDAIYKAGAPECVWLLEHPPLYTGGTSAKAPDLLNPKFPVFETGRGGEYTYHGPGQRVAYVMLNLKERQNEPDLKKYVWQLEEWIIRALAALGVKGERREGRVGIWVRHLASVTPAKAGVQSLTRGSAKNHIAADAALGLDARLHGHDEKEDWTESKIAAIGVRVRHWVTFHGISINVDPDLSHYAGIVPCGINDYGVTSLAALGIRASMDDLDAALKASFSGVFNV